MRPSQKARYGCEAARKWRTEVPPAPLMKRAGGAPQPWPIHPHPMGPVHRTYDPPPPPHLPLFHSRHAEESAERPHLVTIVRPCGQTSLRKVTVLLNRRGVVSFEQLLLDISEALGFPRWHRARVTRLFTSYAREVKGVCDFFRGEVAFVALGKTRPELSSVQEALEELYPEHSGYRADALLIWEKKLRPAPDKATKADSGYSEGTDSNRTRDDTKRHVKNQANAHAPHLMDAQQTGKRNLNIQMSHKKNTCRRPVYFSNHLQKLHVRCGVKEPQPSAIGPFKHEEGLGQADVSFTKLCENCLARRDKHPSQERINSLSGRVPLPPVSRKQKRSSSIVEEVRKLDIHVSPPPPQPISGDEEWSLPRLQRLDPLPGVCAERTTFDLPSDGTEVTLSDIERCYEIGRVVGDGNFAVVRECRRCDNNQTLAVKIVERSKLIGREHMMQNELSLLSSLCHPRIVRLFTHHHTYTHSYLVMELVSGGDLFEAISERGKFSEAEAGLMVSDVSEALNYIHCKSIVHRDLKPENLLIERVAADICRLKLGDFGLAMVVTEPVFTICGTPTYVAPEILSETGYGVAVDVWALGVILYILLCGFPPFRSRNRDQEELFQLIKQGQLHFLPPYWDPISEEVKSLIGALLQSDPTLRLTAEQTLLHPWVKAMAAICRQRVLTDKTEKNTVDTGVEPERVQKPAQADAAEAAINKTNTGSEGAPGRHDERPATRSTGGGQEFKQPQQLSMERSTGQSICSQIKAHTLSEATPAQQNPECTSTDSGSPRRPFIQHSGLNPTNTDCDSISPTSPSQPIAPAAQTEPLSLIETHRSTQNSLQTDNLQHPTNTEPQTAAGHPTPRHPSSHPAENHEELTTDTTINHPDTLKQPQPH